MIQHSFHFVLYTAEIPSRTFLCIFEQNRPWSLFLALVLPSTCMQHAQTWFISRTALPFSESRETFAVESH